MPPKPKPNGYSVFVEERCRQTGIHRAEGFTRFTNEWKTLEDSVKENYKELAKALKSAAPPAVPPLQQQNKQRSDRLLEGFKRTRPADDGDSSSANRLPPYDREPLSTSSSAPPPMKKVYIGEQDGDHVAVELPDEFAFKQQSVVAFPVTSPQESLENINEAYRNLADTTELSVFSFSCVPVVSSAGHKKGAILGISIPLEISITGFSLQEGMMEEFYHAYIDPGPLPQGAVNDADDTRKERHGMPWSATDRSNAECERFFDHGEALETDYLAIYAQILDFVGFTGKNGADLMPMCCRAADLEVNEECLRWLHGEAGKRFQKADPDVLPGWTDLPMFAFASLEDFAKIAVMRRCASQSVVPFGYNEDSLKTAFGHFGFYRQIHNLNCWYHRKVTSVKNCALGAARESCFIVTSYLKSMYDLPDSPQFVYMGGPHHDDSDEE